MRKWLPLLAICLGSFMLLVDVTIVNVALPDIAVDLSSSFTSLQWVINAYALVLAALLLGFGSLSDAVGHRRLYVFGLGVFVVASVVCGSAIDPTMLIAARALQGIGGAAMFATTFALLNNAYDGRDRGTAYGVWGAVSGAAAALGPVIGGLLTQAISWRWIFFVNVPVGVAAIVLTLTVIAAVGGNGRRRLDWPGMAAFVLAAASLTFGLTRSSADGWTSVTVLVCLGVAVLSLVAFVVIESHVAEPVIDLSLFRRRVFTGTVIAAFVLSLSGFGVLTYTTIWMQTLLGLSPVEAGLVSLPLPVLSSVLSATSGRFMQRVPRTLAVGGGLLLIGVGALLSALLVETQGGWVSLLPGLAITGFGTGMCVPIMSSSAAAAVGAGRAGIASGAINTARQLGQALGIALLGSLTAIAATSSLRSAGIAHPNTIATSLIGGGAGSLLGGRPRPQLDQALNSAFTSGLALAFLAAGGLSVVAAIIVGRLVRGRAGQDDAPAPDAVSYAAPEQGRQRQRADAISE